MDIYAKNNWIYYVIEFFCTLDKNHSFVARWRDGIEWSRPKFADFLADILNISMNKLHLFFKKMI